MRIIYILLALVILMILITAHEFGHYLAGKIFKFKINEFSIGFGPAIYKKTKKNGEIFSVRALPLGGYCAFEGEDQETDEKQEQAEKSEDSTAQTEPLQDNKEQIAAERQPVVAGKKFNDQPAWKRLIVLFGGVFFNFLFGIITSAIYLMVAGYGVPLVGASMQAEVLQGDKVVAINGTRVEAYRPMSDILSKYSGENTLVLTIVRNGETIEVEVTKKELTNGYYYVANTTTIEENLYVYNGAEYVQVKMEDFHQDVINATLEYNSTDEKYYPILSDTYYTKTGESTYTEYVSKAMIEAGVLGYARPGTSLGIMYYTAVEHYGFFECLYKAWPFGFYICKVILGALGGIFTGATKISDLGGTITTISTIATYSAMNPLIILYLFPMLSFNLAIFNILPIPALDGARMVFVLWEMITRKPVNRKVEGYIHTIGLFVLLALVIFLDVYHLFV